MIPCQLCHLRQASSQGYLPAAPASTEGANRKSHGERALPTVSVNLCP